MRDRRSTRNAPSPQPSPGVPGEGARRTDPPQSFAMIRSAITVSLVPEARGGPFVFWDDLPAACATAASLGFDAVEVFAPSGDALKPDELRQLLGDHGL